MLLLGLMRLAFLFFSCHGVILGFGSSFACASCLLFLFLDDRDFLFWSLVAILLLPLFSSELVVPFGLSYPFRAAFRAFMRGGIGLCLPWVGEEHWLSSLFRLAWGFFLLPAAGLLPSFMAPCGQKGSGLFFA